MGYETKHLLLLTLAADEEACWAAAPGDAITEAGA